MIYVHKLAFGLMNPLTIVALLIFVSLLTSKIWPRVTAILLLLICSNPLVANFLIGSLERKYEKVVFHELPQMDVLIVLSGMSNRIQNSDGSMARLKDCEKFGKKHKIKIATIADLISYRLKKESFVSQSASCSLPRSFKTAPRLR